MNKAAGERYHLVYGAGLRAPLLGAAADEHVRPADAREGRPADVPRHVAAARRPGGGAARVRRRDAAARLHLRGRRRRRLPPGGVARRRRTARSSTSAASCRSRSIALRDAARRADRRRVVPARSVPGGAARRSTSATTSPTTRRSARASAGSRRSACARGIARSLELLPRARGVVLVSVSLLDLGRRADGEAGRPRGRVRGRRSRAGWFVGGPALERFEAEFAAYCGVRHCGRR